MTAPQPWRLVVRCPMGHQLTATVNQIAGHHEGKLTMSCPKCEDIANIEAARLMDELNEAPTE